MPVITLLTDFGRSDEYVALMKGVIISVNPYATIIDISHHIDPQDIIQAAYIIQSSYRYFPEGSVHLIVVDPGVGSDRALLALEMMGQTFLAPDNGVLTLVMDEGDIDSIVRIDNSNYFLESVSRTFHGRDIFAPVGAHISKGLEIKKLGPPADPYNLVRLNVRKPYVSDNNELVGSIISVDRFGNLITNIDSNSLERFCETNKDNRLEIDIGENRIIGLSQSYESAELQSPLAIIGSRGCLELAVNCGSARQYFMAGRGDIVRIGCRKKTSAAHEKNAIVHRRDAEDAKEFNFLNSHNMKGNNSKNRIAYPDPDKPEPK